ncbi:hypothetical protein M8818_001947 [Zalaria obscura]|uniref:Uncharacterized protein n=1 Tax=Zalaria obscura TaxID=2024903 RepID=A0ACC3SJI7_9PEZI
MAVELVTETRALIAQVPVSRLDSKTLLGEITRRKRGPAKINVDQGNGRAWCLFLPLILPDGPSGPGHCAYPMRCFEHVQWRGLWAKSEQKVYEEYDTNHSAS